MKLSNVLFIFFLNFFLILFHWFICILCHYLIRDYNGFIVLWQMVKQVCSVFYLFLPPLASLQLLFLNVNSKIIIFNSKLKKPIRIIIRIVFFFQLIWQRDNLWSLGFSSKNLMSFYSNLSCFILIFNMTL